MLSINNITSQLSAGGSAARDATKLADDFDTFLQMLLTQLQAQDPLEPQDSSEFTNQLVQFTSVEQSIQQNKNLETLANLTAFNSLQNTVGFIGKKVTIDQSAAMLEDGQATWHYDLGAQASKFKITIQNANGQEVYKTYGTAADATAGEHQFTWDGITSSGAPAAEGPYVMVVEASDSNDNVITSNIYMKEVVDGIDFEGGESILNVAGFKIPVDDIRHVGVA